MSAFWDHANSSDWWDGPDRFKRINRTEVALIQNEALLRALDVLALSNKLDVGGPTPGAPSSFVTCNIVPGRAQVTGDACALPFEPTSFAVVFSAHTIEHVADAGKFLGECDRVLSPGGILCVVCPDRRVFQHSDEGDELGVRAYEEFAPDELRDRFRRALPDYALLSFDTRQNNYDFEIIARKP